MTTPRDDIAGLSERLRKRSEPSEYSTGDVLGEEAATQLDSLLKEREALQARVKELERDNGIFRDMQCDVLEQAWAAESRATRLQQERDEAYERAAKEAEGPLFAGKYRGSEGHNWWHEKQPYGYEHDYGNGRHDAAAAIRRLAGPEKEKKE